jgi:hypothetical protein
MCVDYMSLNMACPKDPSPLPQIDQVMDLTTGCKLLSLLDTYLGYHQISLTEVDQSASTFIAPLGCFCYVKMSFRSKNEGATYQRCMQSCFKEQIGCNLEVYIDDIVVNTRRGNSLMT